LPIDSEAFRKGNCSARAIRPQQRATSQSAGTPAARERASRLPMSALDRRARRPASKALDSVCGHIEQAPTFSENSALAFRSPPVRRRSAAVTHTTQCAPLNAGYLAHDLAGPSSRWHHTAQIWVPLEFRSRLSAAGTEFWSPGLIGGWPMPVQGPFRNRPLDGGDGYPSEPADTGVRHAGGPR
jgi:hypothetical protein